MAAASDRPPLIGITTSEVRRPEITHPLPESEPPQPELALGMPYVRALARSGAVPVVLPPLAIELVPALLRPLAGICLSGGPDIDPTTYGADPHPDLGPVEPALDAFELAVARHADEAGLPILGICRGCQALNVARGGSLHQHLPAVADGSVDHRQAAAGWKVTHQVTVEPRSRLAQALGAEALAVNSFHHQAVQRLGDGLRAVAWAADGTVEGIEDDARFVLGVQWHAETLEEVERPQARLFTALVDAALASAVALR
jgi:putative glutamine amidotransferase